MRKTKLILKRILIIYVLLYVLLSSLGTCFARSYDAACGEYVSQYARDFIAEYCTPTETKTVYDSSVTEPHWGGGSFGQGTFYACCSTGVKYMYELALGINIYDYDFHPMCGTSIGKMESSSYWTNVTNSTLQPGDIVISSEHVEMYIGNNENANFGNSPHSGKVTTGPRLGSDFTKAFRLSSSVDVNPSGKVGSASALANINYSNFFFNGIPDGKYSLASKKSLLATIIDFLANILDYLIGILTYIVRIVFVGWTAIFDNLLNWTVETVVDTGTDPAEAGLSPIEVENTKKEDRKVTIESLLFNKFDLLNINIFE